MTSQMRIRPAVANDAETLSAIATAAKAFWGYSAAQLAAWRSDLSPTPESIGTRPTFLAEVESEAAGFYQLHIEGEWAELEHLWVHPRFMCRGVGRALLNHAAETAARRGAIAIEIDADPNAEAFYAACGAIRIGMRPAPIDGQTDRVLPRLRLMLGQRD